jgi:hypothetical protein
VGLRSAIVRFIGGGVIAEAVEKALSEASVSSIGLDADEQLWRSVTGSPRPDLLPYQRTKAVAACFELHQRNPLGHRITEVNRDFIVGDGVTYDCRNTAVEDIVGEFWTDDDNDLDTRLGDFALEIGLNGELAPEVFVGGVSGIVKLGYVDPGQIKDIKALEVGESRNPLVADLMYIRQKGYGVKGKELQIVRRRDGKLAGDVFFWKVNSPSNSPRGWPDLLHLADWLDAYDEFLWDSMERGRMMRAFIWDVLYRGGTEPEIQEWVRKNGSAPKAGSVRVHNENIEWKAVAPELGAFEAQAEAQVLLEHMAGGAGLPKTWLAAAEDVNRATAREMGTPTERRLATRQRFFLRKVVRGMVAFVLEQAMEAGRLKTDNGLVEIQDENGTGTNEFAKPIDLVQIHAPEISPRDIASSGTLILNLATALSIAEDHGWVGKQPIRKVLAMTLANLGYNTDARALSDGAKEKPPPPPRPDLKTLPPVPVPVPGGGASNGSAV